MACLKPLHISVTPPLGGQPEIIRVPCGKCYACRLDRAKDWALRCMHEASLHDHNCFLTLTYRDVPEGGTLVVRDVQLFFKRLRKHIDPVKISYYACGEYGEKLGRPHYHVLLFGYNFEDLEVQGISHAKSRFSTHGQNIIWKSEILDRIWGHGYCWIGSVTLQSAGYVARYVRKKITGPPARDHYRGKLPEFALMSRNPAIGKRWFEKYKNDVYPKDFTTWDGRKYRAPKYYDKLLMRSDWRMYEAVKAVRVEKSDEEMLPLDRRIDKEKYLMSVTKTLKRSYEDGRD